MARLEETSVKRHGEPLLDHTPHLTEQTSRLLSSRGQGTASPEQQAQQTAQASQELTKKGILPDLGLHMDTDHLHTGAQAGKEQAFATAVKGLHATGEKGAAHDHQPKSTTGIRRCKTSERIPSAGYCTESC